MHPTTQTQEQATRIIVDGKTIILNSDQLAALAAISKFLKTTGQNFLCVRGPAGSGKTTIIKEALNGRERVAVSAPTHKAKKVVGRFTGRKSVTLHSLLGLRPDMDLEDFDKHNLLFSTSGDSKMHEYGYLVIDECSQVGPILCNIIKQAARECNTKIIFIGDIFQCLPVRKNSDRNHDEPLVYDEATMLSPIFTDPEILQVQITKVERQKGSNPLMQVYDAIRSNILSPVDLFARETNIINGEGIAFYSEPVPFAELTNSTFGSSRDPNYAKILCWKNETVRRWNNFVRKSLYGSYNESLQPGELLMSYRSIYDNINLGMITVNSAEYLVVSVKPAVQEGIKGWDIYIRDAERPNAPAVPVFIVMPEMENYIRFIHKDRFHYDLINSVQSSKRKWMRRKYMEFRNRFLFLEDVRDRRGNLLVKKDLDFAYALSVHKSQGSTYRYVFIDETDINGNKLPWERNRLKYVALSRPTNIAHVLKY